MTNAETPLTPLETLLVEAADNRDDAAASSRFTDAVLDTLLGVPGTPGAAQDQFHPLTITDHRDVPLAVAFTSPERYAAFAAAMELADGQFEVRGIDGRGLFGMLVRNNLPLVLNPHNAYGKEFTVPEMSDLAVGVSPDTSARVFTERTTLKVGEASSVPDGLLDRLTAYLAGLGGVESATLAWVEYPDGLQGYLLGIRSTVERERILAGMGRVVGDLGGRTLDIMYAAPGEELTTDVIEPFWAVGSGA
ncbi:MAG: SseB family protein [Nocardioides sp.]